MTNRHTDITLSFLIVGHTKFSPDWCFGLVKQLYWRTAFGSLNDIVKVCNEKFCVMECCNHIIRFYNNDCLKV